MSDATTPDPAPSGQAKYQVRFDWGVGGAHRILAGAHVAVLVDALLFTTLVVVAAENGEDSPASGVAAAALDAEVAERELVVLAASLRNRAAVADRILALQEERGERMIVAVIGAGEPADNGRGIRFAIEDQLTAGAVVDALVALGLDHTSPEAAVASAAYEGLRQAAVHLIGASGSGAELVAAGRKPEVRLATQLDVTRVVPELRDGVFRA
ncbi:2-phosphosulfolactate phosphatase [Agromyces sp. Marseille-P2726]|uniref:2-phosphosulfolactate phosphatase n=1 Tax=Agromyces sp. Marseille-P2726 TaxID=2709132 RepID=UPI00157065F7|nr:2-phosphosulfolactate phosphatase [Agromyces sp. Marseille-P2726]